jgi:large subunit ribosomal protein L15
MNLSNLKPAKGSVKSQGKWVEGQGSGKGWYCYSWSQRAKSRSGYSKNYSEGGQMPLQTSSKFGFKQSL